MALSYGEHESEHDSSDFDSEDEEGSKCDALGDFINTKDILLPVSCEENAYGALTLACLSRKTRWIPLFSSLFLALGTFWVQMLFTAWMIPSISKNEYQEKYAFETREGTTLNLFALWRNPKENTDQDMGKRPDGKPKLAWAYHACTENDWSWAQDRIEDLQKFTHFLGPMIPGHEWTNFFKTWRAGTVFGICTLIVWSGAILKALRQASGQIRMIWLKNDNENIEKFHRKEKRRHLRKHPDDSEDEDGEIRDAAALDELIKLEADPEYKKFHGMMEQHQMLEQRKAMLSFNWETWKFKIAVGMTVGFRILVILSLGYYGLVFLVYTDNLKDFILNSVALGFVLDIPDIVFSAFASLKVKQNVKDQSNRAAREVIVSGYVSAGSGLIAVFFAFIAVAWAAHELVKFSWMLDKSVLQELCARTPGNTTLQWPKPEA